MSSTTFYGGSNRVQTSINNLWGAVNALSSGGTGTGNMTYSGVPSIGKHYIQDSLDGRTAISSKLLEDSTSFNFGSNDLVAVNNIDCNEINIGTTEYKNQSITDAIEINLNAPFIKSNAPSVIFSETTQISSAPSKNLTVLSDNYLSLYGGNINVGATNNIILNSNDFVNINTGNMNINSGAISTNSNITGNSFIKSGGTAIQYLMANGSTLSASSNSGNSNYYLYNSGTSENPTPPNGYITYNSSTQSEATIIYISHITRDNVDIEVFFKQITTITEVYVQDENNSGLFIQYSVAGTPIITLGAQVEIPVLVNSQGTNGFSNGQNVFISFFTNGIEVDSRLSSLEDKTQFQTAPSGTTAFSSNVDLSNNELNNVSKMTTIYGTLNIGYSNTDNYTSTETNIVFGNGNTINDNEQIIFGNHNSILSNQTVVIGASNTNIKTGLGNVIGHGNSVKATIANVMGYNNVIGGVTDGYFTQCIGSNNVCDGLYASAFGTDITNNTEHSLCLGDSAISTIFPNSSVCDLGNITSPFKDIYYSGSLMATSKLDLSYINSFFIGIQFQHGSGSLTLMSNSLWTALGSTSSAFLPYALTNNYTRQLCCGYWTFPTPANGQVCGYASTLTTGIQVSTGYQWGLYMALFPADTGSPFASSAPQNFWGLWNLSTALPLNQTTQLSIQRNMICFGSATADVNVCIYTAGASSTVKQVDLGTDFPSNRTSGADPTFFYRLALYWDGTKIYYKAINTTSNITVRGSFTPLITDIPASTINLYPQCVRIQGTPSSTTGSRLKVQRFGVFY